MDNEGEDSWERYYAVLKGRGPRPLFNKLMLQQAEVLQQAEEQLEQGVNAVSEPRMAIDLGCGDGTETLVLLDHGWQVFAIDSQPAAINSLLKKTSSSLKQRLQAEVVSFEAVNLPAAELVYAGLSLPFCPPGNFPLVWQKVINSILPGGVFAGHFFGDRDEWASKPEMTFFTFDEVKSLFERFDIMDFNEVDEPGGPTLRDPKHWHLFEVIARRRP